MKLRGIADERTLAIFVDAIDFGEYVMAVEDLCVNLYEVDARLPRGLVEEIAALVWQMQLRPERWQFVRDLKER